MGRGSGIAAQSSGGRGFRARVSQGLARLNPLSPTYPNGEFGYEPRDVLTEGKPLVVPWRTFHDYGGNPGDMFWLKDSKVFVVLHNKYSPSKKNPGAVTGGHREAYRGTDLKEALYTMEEIAALEGAKVTLFDELIKHEALRLGFPVNYQQKHPGLS